MPFAATDATATDPHGHLFETAAEAKAFILAGNATFTIVSKKTQARFTYRVRKPKDADDISFVQIMNGSDNESSFAYVGFIRNGIFTHGGRKARAKVDAPSVMAFGWTFISLMRDSHLPTTVEIWHEGRCGRCNRKLTVPSSIRSGLGPECATK
jgi:hypothetical protein